MVVLDFSDYNSNNNTDLRKCFDMSEKLREDGYS